MPPSSLGFRVRPASAAFAAAFCLCGVARAEPPVAPSADPAVTPTASPAAAPPPAPPAPAPTPAPPGESAPAAVAAPAPAAATAPTPVSAPSAPLPQTVVSPGEAIVHVAVNYRGAWLETRDYVDQADFRRTCPTPCDLKLRVEGLEARVVAPGMTTSNVFRIDAGAGVAGIRVDGGSASARRTGIITLAAGIPVALAGMALFALGRVHDEPGLEAGGIAGLAVGGVSVAIALPLLVMGTTSVKNAKGSQIALAPGPGPAL